MPDLVPLLLEAPAQGNPIIIRLLQAIANARGEPLPDLPTLLSIYTGDELSIFTAFQNLSDEEFLDLLQLARIEGKYTTDILITSKDVSDCCCPARRLSDLQHLQAPHPIDPRYKSTTPQLIRDFQSSAQALRVSAASAGSSRPSSFDIQAHSTVASTPANTATPNTDYPSPYLELVGNPTAVNEPKPTREHPVDEEVRYRCYKCRYHWPADATGLEKWTKHQMLTHNGSTRYICGHVKCTGSGKTYETLMSHHHKKHHKDCLEECPHDHKLSQESPGRVVCACLDCEKLVIFSGDDCFHRLVQHWKEEHRDLIITGSLNKNPKNFSQRMENLIREREELGVLFQHHINQQYPNEQPILLFNPADKNVKTLFKDLQFGLDGPDEKIQAKEADIVRTFLTLSTPQFKTTTGQTGVSHQAPQQHDSPWPAQQPNRPEYPPRRDSIYPVSSRAGYVAPVTLMWDSTQGSVPPMPPTASSAYKHVTAQESSRPMSGVYQTGVIEAYMPPLDVAYYPVAEPSANLYYTQH
jgi:hypothetical protein